MYNAPPPNLMQGIHLLEAGRRAEALAYLRLAARTESLPADGWLWLAAASDDREEYRYCVSQALRLDPQHPVANRMRAELERQDGYPMPPPDASAYTGATGAIPAPGAGRRPSRLRRALRVLVLGVLIGGCLGVLASLIVSGVAQDAVRDAFQAGDMHSLRFDVGAQPAYGFRVEVPETWLPANTDSASWRETRDALAEQFPTPEGQISVWEMVEQSFSRAVRDPVYGTIMPPVRLVETDPDWLDEANMVAALTLAQIVPFAKEPEGSTATVCDRVERAGERFDLGTEPGAEVLSARLVRRDPPADCAYVIDRRITDQPAPEVAYPLTIDRAPTTTRAIVLLVPVGTERYAVWVVTLADAVYGDYADAIDRIAETLTYQPS
jgi:hypothetical protein